ncbi:hypothetical protein Trydic_g19672 [Trypoxylus dichotomus]
MLRFRKRHPLLLLPSESSRSHTHTRYSYKSAPSQPGSIISSARTQACSSFASFASCTTLISPSPSISLFLRDLSSSIAHFQMRSLPTSRKALKVSDGVTMHDLGSGVLYEHHSSRDKIVEDEIKSSAMVANEGKKKRETRNLGIQLSFRYKGRSTG